MDGSAAIYQPMDFLVNTIVDYFAANNDMSLAVVIKPGTERFQVQGVSKTEKITPRQVACTHGQAGKDVLASLVEIQTAVRATMQEIEIDLLWEAVLEKGLLGAFTGPLTAGAAGIMAAVLAGLVVSFFTKPKST